MPRALVVIDIQNDYFPGGALPLWQAEDTEARILDAIGRAQAAGDRVILVRHLAPAGSGLFAEDSAGSEIRAGILAAASDAPVVIKRFADSFQDTALMDHLDGVQDLLICGMMTQNCVVFTAMSRAADGFGVQVIGDLCTAPIAPVHLIALSALASKIQVTEAAQVWPA